jgi:hypothetical protein
MANATEGGTEFDPAALDRAERAFWRQAWDAVPPAVAAAHAVRRADFGPIQATVTGDPAAAGVDFLLGAGEPGASGAHLKAAVEWARRFTSDAVVPVPAGAESASELTWLGFRQTSRLEKFVRDPHPPRFPAPDGIDVVELVDADEGQFGQIIATVFEFPPWTASIFDSLPGRPDWRCYAARIGERTVGAATLFGDGPVAQLGSACVLPDARGRHGQAALLRRRIEDAVASGAGLLATDVERGTPAGDAGARNLLKAGFEPAYVRPVWTDARLPAS